MSPEALAYTLARLSAPRAPVANDSNLSPLSREIMRDLYDKLKSIAEIFDQGGRPTKEQTDEVETVLKKLAREIDPNNPYGYEPVPGSSEGASAKK
ncbi:hypothetical protein ACHAPK_007669 [Fusarium culmorum]|uniref:Uncharacterized protein n=1 Tax=Fusarium culmorum TaxID=5516 RepID=A0A2T4GDN9_FUSCU|nr:hypothetical protein FCULG_00010619 [Fusarium culmorum]